MASEETVQVLTVSYLKLLSTFHVLI